MALLEASRIPNKMKPEGKAGLSPLVPHGRRADTYGVRRGSIETVDNRLGASSGLRNIQRR